MELMSEAFEHAVQEAFDKGPSVVATLSISPLPFLTKLKHRRDVEIVPLTPSNRETVYEELSARLSALCNEDEAVRQLGRMAERICEMIITGEAALIDIEIQQEALRHEVLRAFPDKEALYTLLFESRFRRLWQQFRQEG